MKARWGFWNNYLVGITSDRWRSLRAANRIDPGYRHRALLLTALSAGNSLHRRREERLHGDAVAATRITDPPLFVLGHWRTGTTFLHDLLACDTDQFAFPNSTQVTFPFTFLTTEAATQRRWGGTLPRTRPMDNVAISLRTPQEDEFALCVAGLRSPYLGMFSFPRRANHYDRYLTFEDVPDPELEAWKTTLCWFLRKLTLKAGRPLLLKSPTHTARIRLLLDLFPGARFVHIHRDPYAVFRSTRHMLARNQAIHLLQRPPEDADDRVVRCYTRMHDAFFAQRSLIPEGQFHELRYEELARDPVGQLEATYERLNLTGFEALRPRLREYVASLGDFRRNEFAELLPTLRERVGSAWRRSFDAWGYPV